MTIPSLETIASYLTIVAAVLGAILAALWLSLVIWTFRDMRLRSRDPFAQILAAIVVGLLPVVGLIIYLILRPPETLAEAYERALEEEALLQEIEERPACPGCSRTVEAGWILCPYCHTRLRKRCLDCDQLLELQWNLCPFCGNQYVDPYHVEGEEETAAGVYEPWTEEDEVAVGDGILDPEIAVEDESLEAVASGGDDLSDT